MTINYWNEENDWGKNLSYYGWSLLALEPKLASILLPNFKFLGKFFFKGEKTILTITLFFSWNDLLPCKAPFATASHSVDDNARRTSTQIKQGKILAAIFLRRIHALLLPLKECLSNSDST